AEWWDPFIGSASGAGGSTVELNLAPYESRVLVFSNAAAAPQREPRPIGEALDISSDWKVTVAGQTVNMAKLRSWSDDENTKFFSGQTVYERAVNVPLTLLKVGREIALNFGEGTPVAPDARPSSGPGMRALLEGP